MNPVSASRKLASMTGELARHPREVPFMLRWLHSMLPGHTPLHDKLPWITFRAIDWLGGFLRPQMSAFEFGAGGSTLFLARRVCRVWSVEHDAGFHRQVRTLLAESNIRNCDLALHEPVPCSDDDRAFASFQDRYRGLCFASYVKAIDLVPDRSLDFVLVDGRARVACVRRALAKVAPGGAIMLDNSDRPAYAEAGQLLAGFERLDLPGLTPWNLEVSQTSVWQVPG